MQSIYAFKQNEESSYHLALEKITQDFNDELLVVGKTEDPRIRREEAAAHEFLKQTLGRMTGQPDKGFLSEKGALFVEDALHVYRVKKSKDYLYHKERMLSEAESIYDRYLFLLLAITEMLTDDSAQQRLPVNPVVTCLQQNGDFKSALKAHNISIDPTLVKAWRKQLKKDEIAPLLTNTYQDFEAAKEIVRTVIKDFLFKNEIVVAYFEEDDLSWSENRSVVKSLLNNTIKAIEEANCTQTPLNLLSKNWDDDKEFFKQLYELFFRYETEYETLISDKTKKWAPERIAVVDKILIVMAVAEILHFSSIPIKVTINEYIEISKTYSTPKSWQYINGMLDEIVRTLEEQGKIRKSGRGLIDNK
jgi:N utilization substance protein B